jgi:hypothetical protein
MKTLSFRAGPLMKRGEGGFKPLLAHARFQP